MRVGCLMCVLFVGLGAGTASAQVPSTKSVNGSALVAPDGAASSGAPQAPPSTERFTLGVKAGLTRSSVSGPGVVDIKKVLASRFGYALGTSVAVRLNDSVSIQPELLVSSKGYRTVETNADNGRVALTYLELPVLVKWSGGETIRPFFYGGGGFALCLKASGAQAGQTIDLSSEVSDTDTFFVVGGGAQRGSVSVEARLERSLSNLAVAPKGTTVKQDAVRNTALALLVGYSFGGR